MNEFAVIGQQLDKEAINNALSACLINENDEVEKHFVDDWPM